MGFPSRSGNRLLTSSRNSSSIMIVFLSELSGALSQGPNLFPAEAVYSYLSANPESSLANVLSQDQQSKKFKLIAEDMLENFLDKQSYNCDPARTFLREILAGVILEMTLKSCSKPEWINGWIVYLLEDGEPDFNQAIDAGMNAKDDLLSSPFNDFDGNVGNVGLAKPQKKKQERDGRNQAHRHMKRLSKAEEAMEEAMEEAKRLSQLIAEEDAHKVSGSKGDIPDDLRAAIEANARKMELQAAAVSREVNGKSAPKEFSEPVSKVIAGPISPIPTEIPPLLPERKPISVQATTSSVASSSTPSVPQAKPEAVSSSESSSFTNFDQIMPKATPVAPQKPIPRRKTVSLTLHNAAITIYDDSTPGETGKLRNKPNGDYLVQIEPFSSQHPGWMIVRRYPDFETLHEVLRRIAQISGVAAFTEQHQTLPNWRDHTKASLRGELERYLREALWYQSLAESEGMKRFLEKDQGQSGSGSKPSGGIGWPTPSAFESMGKGMLDVLASAPKGVAEGGKALGGGISGVFQNIGNLGQKKSTPPANTPIPGASRTSTSNLPRSESTTSLSGTRRGRASEDSLRPTNIVQTQPAMIPPMERRPSYHSIIEDDNEQGRRGSTSARSSMSGRRSMNQSREPSRAPSIRGTPISSPTHNLIGDFRLPPPPSDIPDDYGAGFANSSSHARTESSATTAWTPTSTVHSQQSPGRPSMSNSSRENISLSQAPARKPRKESPPLSEPETRVAVELLFAVINELYTLSSAWNIRRTLLTAAKTFLLRPGNPSLSSIQSLIQDSVIASSTSDAGVASILRKLRVNGLPTEEELKSWPAEMSSEEKERLRIKARKLLVERGVPAALTGVMGNAATAEAMGKVFDCLQVEEVARGLIFGLLLQGVRAVTH